MDTKTNAFKNADDYIESLEGDRKEAIATLHKKIKQVIPGEEIKMWGKIIGYGTYHYKYQSGREGDWMSVGLTSGVQYMSLYICAGKNGEYLAEANKEKLGKVSVGKSCIRFKKLEDLNLDVALDLVKESVELLKTPDGVIG